MANEQEKIKQTRRGKFTSNLRNNFLTGLAVIIPVFITTYLIWSTIGLIDSWVLPLIPQRYAIDKVVGIDIKGVGEVVCVAGRCVREESVGGWVVGALGTGSKKCLVYQKKSNQVREGRRKYF